VNKKADAFRKKLGKRIKEVRKEQRVTQAQLSFESGIGRRVIVHIEQGIQNVTVDTLSALADALNVKTQTFFDFD
jgi:transcriptional regulator with XRE-family HTH domain